MGRTKCDGKYRRHRAFEVIFSMFMTLLQIDFCQTSFLLKCMNISRLNFLGCSRLFTSAITKHSLCGHINIPRY